MIINHNLSAMNAQRQMGVNQTNASKSMEKLSSGLRINRAGDDAAGLAISEKMRSQIRGLDQANRNAQDGISMIQTAEGALSETHSILQRMRELSVQSSNDTNTAEDRTELQKEIQQLSKEITRIGNDTEFNTKTLLDGGLSGTGTAATNEQSVIQKSDLETFFDTGSTGSLELKLGDTTYTITGSDSVAPGTTPTVSGNTITIGTSGAVGTVDDIIAGLSLVAAADAESDIAQFTFTKDGSGNLQIDAKDNGKFAGAQGNGSIYTDDIAYSVTAGEDGADGKVKLQIGANDGQKLEVEIGDMRAEALGTEMSVGVTKYVSDIDISTEAGAQEAMKILDGAIGTVSAERSKLGAYQNRLEHTINNLGTSSENLTAAESRVRDVDMAKEMMEMSKNNILQQASQAMLAQANQQPQQVLQLLR